jgi:hypothetical protein
MAKLASVQVITELRPIENADSIEVATVLGWQVVVKKNEFKVGDKVCYIQIDATVPDKPEYEFLRERKFKVKTIKLRKQISQGLIVPLPEGKWKEDDDLTAVLGVTKHEKIDNNPVVSVPRDKSWWGRFKYAIRRKLGLVRESSPFPTDLVSITDEERIQNIPKVLEKYKGKEFILCYKLDGSSITIIHSKWLFWSKFRICSRRFELHKSNNDWHRAVETTNFKEEILKLVKHYKTNDIIVQGEAIGKFNGNHHNLPQSQIRLFNIFVDGVKVGPEEFVKVCKSWNIPYCPMHSKVVMNHTLAEVLEMSKIKDILNPQVEAEGLVWRSVDGTLSFKAINNNYLLKEK